MKIKHYLILTVLVLAVSIANSQISIPANTTVTENFNGIGNTGTASLPANWKFSAPGTGLTANWNSGGNTSATTQAANSGSPVTGGVYNWASSSGTDRAIGFMSDGSFGSPNAILAWYRNTTGTTVNTVTITFNIERYRINTGSFNLLFYSSVDGSNWVARSTGNISAAVLAPGSSSFTFSNPKTITKSVTITGLTLANNDDIYFRWVLTTSGGIQSQGVGLDNVSVYAGNPTPQLSAELKVKLMGDANSNHQVNAGDVLTYTATLKNTGSGAASNVNYTNLAPANTSITGLIKTSALARNDAYSTPVNTILNGTSVLTNDFGLPALTVVSFGSPGNAITTANGANTATTENGGTVMMNTNGTFSYTPAAGFTGPDRFVYVATTGNAPDNDAEVVITVGSSAFANNDTYLVTGNVGINPLAAAGVLANDAGDNKTVIAVNGSTGNVGVSFNLAQGGALMVNVDGSFTYDPPAGYEGSEQFNYTIDNGHSAPVTATVTLTISGMIWFVNNNAGSNGSGKLSSPFNSLANFQAVNNGTGNNPAPNDDIFLYESSTAYTGPVTLLDNQQLTGQDATNDLATITGYTFQPYTVALPAMNSGNATRVNITTGGAGVHAITLNSGGSSNGLAGFTITNTSGTGINGNGFGTLVIDDCSKDGTGNALALTNGTINGSMDNIISTSSATAIVMNNTGGTFTVNSGNLSGGTAGAVSLTSVGGNLTFNNFTITNPAGTALLISGGSAGPITFNGTISQNTASRLLDIQGRTSGSVIINSNLSATTPSTGILLQNNTGGTISLAGSSKVVNTGTNTPLTITSNTGAAINLSNGGLALTSSSSTAMNVSGGGTITVTGTGNSITSGSGTALSVQNTTIGAANLNFQSITCNGASTGILLNNTGSGGLTVTGTGSAASGGTIQNCVQRGARFVSASNISLSWMNFTGNGTANLDAAGTAGDALNGTNTNVAAGIDLQTVNGFTASNVNITGGVQIGLNGKGVSNFVLTNCAVQNAGDEVLEDGVQLVNLSGTCTVTNSNFTGNFHRQFEVQNGTGSLNLAMTGCTFNKGTYVSTSGQGVLMVAHTNATFTGSIKSSSFQNNFGSAFTGQTINNGNLNITLGSNGLASTPAEGNTFTNNSLAIQMLTDDASVLNFGIGNNTITVTSVVTSGATPVTFRKGTNSTGFLGGTYGYNTIGTFNVAGSGTNMAGTNGLSITNDALSGGMNITIRNNTFNSIAQRGMEFLGQRNDNANIVVINNLFQSPNPNPTGRAGHAIFMQSGTNATAACNLCADISGNTVSGVWDDITSGNMRLRMFPGGGLDKFRLRGLASGSAIDVVNFLTVNNTNALPSATTPTAFLTGGSPCF